MAYRGSIAKTGRARFKFVRETLAELRKVVWLTRREVAYLTALVLVISIAAAVVLGIIDYVFTKLVDGLFLGR